MVTSHLISKVFSSFEGSDLIIYVSDITEKKINDKINNQRHFLLQL